MYRNSIRRPAQNAVRHSSSLKSEVDNEASGNQNGKGDWTKNPTKHYVVQIGEHGGTNPVLFDRYAKSTINKRKIPSENFFGEMANNLDDTMFNSPNDDSLASLDSLSRLDVVVHGNQNSPFEVQIINEVNEDGKSIKKREETLFPAKVMAEKLVGMGLREVGVLRLDSCNVGAGAYLQQLRAALSKLNVKVGYLAAPNGYLQDVHIPFTSSRPVYNWRFWEDRWTVVKGNVDIDFAGTRYTKCSTR